VSQQKLDLLQFSSGIAAQPSAGGVALASVVPRAANWSRFSFCWAMSRCRPLSGRRPPLRLAPLPQMLAVFQGSSKAFRENVSSFGRCHRWYDIGMTRAKIAISLPKDQLARVHREVRAGRADSVSGYIASALAEQEKRDSLRTLLRDLIEQHGKPAPEDVKWAERMLPRRGRG
jgi:hypothetical protein